jgi:hypothetical protein
VLSAQGCTDCAASCDPDVSRGTMGLERGRQEERMRVGDGVPGARETPLCLGIQEAECEASSRGSTASGD